MSYITTKYILLVIFNEIFDKVSKVIKKLINIINNFIKKLIHHYLAIELLKKNFPSNMFLSVNLLGI
jgi:hypothetical protein